MIKNITTDTNYSVLMSVYAKEKAEHLRLAMSSIFDQTIPTNDFVLVCDGPLNKELDDVISEMSQKHAEILHVVKVEKNVGLGNALNIGIRVCKNEIVARMDSDDISRPDRCEKELQIFNDQPEVSIVSGIIEEFTVSTDIVEARRVLPEHQEDILLFSKRRNPFNHPCVMYKKSAVSFAGGYKDFYLLEDYYLWIRMLQSGFVGYNLQQPLLWMRAGSDMYKRRSGLKYAKSQKELFKFMRISKYITRKEYFCSVFLRTSSSLLPNVLRELLYKKMVRNNSVH